MDIPFARQSAGAGDYVEGELKMSDLISRKVLDLWNRYKPTIAVDAIEYDRELNELLGTNLAEVGTDCISRQAAIDALAENMPSTYTPDGSHPADEGIFMAQEIYADCIQTLKELPSAQPEVKQISYTDCANAMLMMWMDKVLTDGEYNRIMDKLNEHEKKKGKDNG